MLKEEVMSKFGFTDQDEFETLLLDLGIDPETEELDSEQVETVKNHVVVYATAIQSLPTDKGCSSQTLAQANGDKSHALTTVTNQGLQVAKEANLNISKAGLETLAQVTVDESKLHACFLENAYWLGLLRHQAQLRATNIDKFTQALKAKQKSLHIDLEQLVVDAGILTPEQVLGKATEALAANSSIDTTTAATSIVTSWA